MKLAAMVLLLVVAGFAVIPDGRCEKMTQSARTHQQPSNSAMLSAEQPPSADAKQGQGNQNIQPADKQYSVAVKEMPPKGGWDKVYVILTGILVAVGIVTFIAIAVQAVQTKKAAEAAKESATAAKMTADVMKVSMLPRLSIGGSDLTKQLTVGSTPRVELTVENKGDTDALQCKWESWIEIIPANATNTAPARGFSAAADHFISDNMLRIASRSNNPVKLNIPIRNHALSAPDLDDLRRLRSFLCVRLLLTYQTVFDTPESGDEWYLGVGHFVLADGFGFLPEYSEYGKRKRQNPN